MKPIAWVTLMVVPIVGLTAIFQFSLVTDLIAQSSFSSAEVFSGIAGIWFIVCIMIAIFFVR